MGGGTKRRGPSHETGLAVSDQMGSVRMVTWSIWTSTLAWPSQVTLGALWRALSRSQAPSFGTRAGAPGRENMAPTARRRKKGSVIARPGRS